LKRLYFWKLKARLTGKCQDAEHMSVWTCFCLVSVIVGFTVGWMSLGKGLAKSIGEYAMTHGKRQYKP
jgi:hypothetical protein